MFLVNVTFTFIGLAVIGAAVFVRTKQRHLPHQGLRIIALSLLEIDCLSVIVSAHGFPFFVLISIASSFGAALLLALIWVMTNLNKSK